jgi:hypothetical protein
MDEPSVEVKREIVKLVFPDLRYGGDPDVARYYELRKAGRIAQALAVYNCALRARYPEDASRVRLLKLYREGDPRYAACQDGLILGFASRLSARIRANIDLIVAPLERADLSDALRALKAVESVLSRLPGEDEGAQDLLVRYDRFARALGHRPVLVRRALDLVREYDAVSRADSPAEYDFVARSAALEARRRAAARPAAAKAPAPSYFDPARISFSEADKARVEVSAALARREDKVLGLCAKYWPLWNDAAFERMVFLYSRKFGGKHFEVFRAIKLGRARAATDDEILSAVAGVLTTGYSYSVSGDQYMQIMWRRLRARMEARAIALRLAAPGPEATTRGGPGPALESRVRARRAEYSGGTLASPRDEGISLRAASRVAAPPERRVAAPKVAPQPELTPAGPAREAALRPAGKARGSLLLVRSPAGPEPLREIRATRVSISDAIRKLSGKNYDVYKKIFLEKVREHIRRALLSNQTRSHSIFDTAANDAEDQVYGFIAAHYDDPFMDWERSAERNAVEALGFAMPSLMPIVEACFKKL